MTSPVRSPAAPKVPRPPAETPQPRQPSSSEPPEPPSAAGDRFAEEPAEALTYALLIMTAVSEDELITHAVTAAGRLTAATVACAVPASGTPCSWGDADLAAALVAALTAEQQPAPSYEQPRLERTAFAHLGLPEALTIDLAGGPLVVASTQPERFGPPAARLLSLVVAHATAGRERLRELALLTRRADCDPLTGLRHYRPFEERLAASVPGRTAVIAVDIDNFKQINDMYGHQAGDDALVAIVGALSRALRGDDHIYRIGGDEFAVVIDVATAAEVTAISRRLLRAARSAGYPISVGAALRSPHETGRETLLRADRALYQAKRAGRNTARLAA